MIKVMLKVLVVGIVFSQNGMAAVDKNVTLKGVGCLADGNCFANVSPAASQSCASNGQVRWDGSTTAGKNFTAAALTAKASGKKVNVGTVDGECNGNFPVLNFLTIN